MKNVLLASLLAVISVLGMEKTISASKLLRPGISFDNAPVNRKALDNFKKNFTAVQNEKWYQFKNRSIVVFESEEVKFTVEYNSRGYVTGIEKLYGEGKMDREIRRIVKSVYFDYNITSVREISVPELFPNPVYIIHIEDENSFKNLSVYDEEMKIMEEYPKNYGAADIVL